MMRMYVLFMVICNIASIDANQTLANLAADTWYKVPNSKMRSVCPTSASNFGCWSIVGAWGGGVYNPIDGKMIVWGGGHGDYDGNEVYAFDIETLTWSRITNPSTGITKDQDPLPDGNPVSRHTYDGLAYITHAKRIFARGGSRAGNGYGTSITWTFDLPTKHWFEMQPSGVLGPTTACCNLSGEYDPYSKKVYMRDPNYLYAYDFDANTWTQLIDWPHGWGPGKSIIDTKRHIYFDIGSGSLHAYNIITGKDISAQWTTIDGETIIQSNYAAAGYDAKADCIVAWGGGGAYVLDMVTKNWSQKSATGAPLEGQGNGTFGRFRYIASDNVFILVNGVDDDVYFYKHTAGVGEPTANHDKNLSPNYVTIYEAQTHTIYDVRGKKIFVTNPENGFLGDIKKIIPGM